MSLRDNAYGREGAPGPAVTGERSDLERRRDLMIFLLIGQSNMVGTPKPEPRDEVEDPRVDQHRRVPGTCPGLWHSRAIDSGGGTRRDDVQVVPRGARGALHLTKCRNALGL